MLGFSLNYVTGREEEEEEEEVEEEEEEVRKKRDRKQEMADIATPVTVDAAVDTVVETADQLANLDGEWISGREEGWLLDLCVTAVLTM